MSNLDNVCAEVFEVFFAVDVALARHVTSDTKCIALGKFLPLVAESMGLAPDSDEFLDNETWIRGYIAKHPAYKVDRGKHGGVRKLRAGENKIKVKGEDKPAEVVPEPPAPAEDTLKAYESDFDSWLAL